MVLVAGFSACSFGGEQHTESLVAVAAGWIGRVMIVNAEDGS